MTIIHEDEETLITYSEGNCDRCVVSFAGFFYGVGLTHWTGGTTPNIVYENPEDEFRKTLNSLAQVPHVYYVTDKKRCWYNSSSFDTIKEVLPAEINRHGFADVFTIGNSAGGFGALIFAPRLPRVRWAIAFGPQSSVHPDCAPFENRWSEHRNKIQEWKILDAVPEITKINYAVIFGATDHRDRQHAARLASTHPILIEGSSHPVGKFLRSQGVLYSFVEHVLTAKHVDDYHSMHDWLVGPNSEQVQTSPL